MFTILISAIILLISVQFFSNSFKKFKESFVFSKEITDLNFEMEKWDRVIATVKKVEFFCDYDFPGVSPDSSGIDGAIAKENFEIEYNDRISKIKSNRFLYGNVNVTYEYIINNVSRTSRTIGLFVHDSDFDIAKKLKPGLKIKAFVNPSDYSEVYIRKTKKEELNKVLNEMIIESVKIASFGFFALCLSLLNYFNDFLSF